VKHLWATLIKNRRLIIITAELFFLAIYLLWQAGQGADAGIPEFIYVNF